MFKVVTRLRVNSNAICLIPFIAIAIDIVIPNPPSTNPRLPSTDHRPPIPDTHETLDTLKTALLSPSCSRQPYFGVTNLLTTHYEMLTAKLVSTRLITPFTDHQPPITVHRSPIGSADVAYSFRVAFTILTFSDEKVTKNLDFHKAASVALISGIVAKKMEY